MSEDTRADKFFAQGEEDGLSQNDPLTDDEFEYHADWMNYRAGYSLGCKKRWAFGDKVKKEFTEALVELAKPHPITMDAAKRCADAAPEREEIAQTLETTPEKLPSGNSPDERGYIKCGEYYYWLSFGTGITKIRNEAHIYTRAEYDQIVADHGGAEITFVPFHEEITQTLEAVNGAVKFDTGKAPMAQGVIRRFPLALQQIALISEYGQRKYGTYDGWEKLDDALNRYTNAGARHDNLVASEGEYDVNDSGLPHRGQKAWNALAELELALREGVVEMTRGNDVEQDVDGRAIPILGSNGRKNDVIK